MKKISITLFVATLVTFISCKEEPKTETPEETKTEVSGLQIVNDSTKVTWTGFKTTEKVGVNGQFKSIDLKDTKTGNSPEEVLNGAAFSIPVSSLFTDNSDRDYKLKTIFFGAMKNTELLSGILNVRDGKWIMTLSMNNVVKEVPLESNYENKLFAINSTINLNDFGGQGALAAINKACYDLHKGADGVSKTWELVEIRGQVLFQ